MFASVISAAILGMEVCPIRVEADVSDGLPVFIMVGHVSSQVKEAQDRVRTALKNNGISLPPKRITVNLAPADIRKEQSGFDLPVAASVLAAAGLVNHKNLEGGMLIGEIGLNGEIRRVQGVLPVVIKAREMGLSYCMLPYDNLPEGRLLEDMTVIGVRDLGDVICYLEDPAAWKNNEFPDERFPEAPEEILDFSDIYGQEGARRAAEIAVSGFHNLLFIGPPGAGKTMIAKRIPTIMPDLTMEESLELTRIYSIAGLLQKNRPLIRKRPFRSPHHSATSQALSGGGRNPQPGEITLAHRGVLFLDEMPEFSRRALEILRQPLEDKEIHIARASGNYTFPANFMLAAAMNPCKCGYYPDTNRCHCTPGEVMAYLGKISQPLLDRIDLCADIPAVTFSEISGTGSRESSAEVKKRVEAALRMQKERYLGEAFSYNAELSGDKVKKYCAATQSAEGLLQRAFEKMNLSARGYHKILKVSRTIADLEGSELIDSTHIAEALSYRTPDRKYWS